jgi:predicted component of type VI protein secretion system
MPARLIVIRGQSPGEEFVLDEAASALLGRSTKADVRVPDPQASRNHCRIQCADGRWSIEDLRSLNGTRVNGRRVSHEDLGPGDEVRIGATAYRFSIDGQPNVSSPEATATLVEKEPERRAGGSTVPDDEVIAAELVEEAEPEAEAEPKAPDAPDAVCAQCGRALAPDSVAHGQATEIGGRLFCRRCVVHHSDTDGGEPDGTPAPVTDTSEIASLLESLERAADADRVEEPSPPTSEPEPPRKPGLLDRLRRKKPQD